tara:strand:- start:10639 stop:11928 length:1290 start_codon:yes stop_codon:yes gene_type:complete
MSSKHKIGIIGLGYVGLPLAKGFCEKGTSIIGFDIDKLKVDSLNNGESTLEVITNQSLKAFIKKKLFKATTSFKSIRSCDAVIICVPTPLDNHHQPDLSFVTNSIHLIKKYLKKGCLLSLESTTYPGTTKDIVKPILEEAGWSIGSDLHLCYSPEREDPGNELFNLRNTPKIISGYTKKCLSKAKTIYSIVCDQLVELPSLESAELCKLIENIQRSVNIGLMNELRFFAEKANINLFEVIDAAATKPFGFTPYYPGPGVGGHCIPIDPFYLTFKAKEYGLNTKFIELAGEVNESMPIYITEKIGEKLNSIGKSFSKSKILCIGLSYKKNVSDCRESPSMEIFNQLLKKGAKTDYYDPLVKFFPKMRKYEIASKSIKLNRSNLKKYDLVVVNVLHDCVDIDLILDSSKTIIDTSGALRNFKDYNKKIITV